VLDAHDTLELPEIG